MSDVLAINGGKPIRKEIWPTYVDGFGSFSPEIHDMVNNVLESGRLFRYDTRQIADTAVGKLENKIKEYFHSKYALAVSSGTTALTLALMSLDLPSGFEVACPTFGFPANPSSILLAGGTPRLFACDENLNLDLEDLTCRWNDKIKVIMVVHMRGMAQPMERIIKFAKEKNVYVVEDAVPALGVSVNSSLLGTMSDIGCFSTQSDKTINTGEGGFLITNNTNFFKRAIVLSGAYESRIEKHLDVTELQNHRDQTLPLYSFRMDELRAAVAIPQFSCLNDKLIKYKNNYNYIVNNIQQFVRVRCPYYEDGFLGDSLVFFVDKERGQEVAEALTAEGINARCLGAPDNVRSFMQWRFLDEVNDKDFWEIPAIKKTSSLLNCAVDIPLSHLLNKQDLDDVIDSIKKVTKILLK